MELIFIGTGSGKTSLSRSHTSIFIRTPFHLLLIDCGDGVSRGLKLQNIGWDEIDSIVITHFHADHSSGLASLITQMKLNNRKKPLTIFAHETLIPGLISLLRMNYLFTETFDFEVGFKGFRYSSNIELTPDFCFKAEQNSHVTNKNSLSANDISFSSCSLKINFKNKSVFYTSDIGSADDLYLYKGERIDYFISESTHISLNDIHRAFVKSSADKLFLTHIDESDEKKLNTWKKNQPDQGKIIITQDGLTIKL